MLLHEVIMTTHNDDVADVSGDGECKITVQNNTSVREKENTTSTACELIMLVLSISVTFSVTCLTVASNDGQYILVHFTR